jgi:two-component sensor histidine kinase
MLNLIERIFHLLYFKKLKFLILLSGFSNFSFAQLDSIPYLTGGMIIGGSLPLKFNEAWLYHKGDNLAWAKLTIDESGWEKITPQNLRADAMPDSLWQGYGWWRLSFRADSNVYEQISRLVFDTWGSAEIYLDGQKILNYGNFSKNAINEKNHVANYAADKHIVLKPAEKHTIAIRFSNHQGKKNEVLLRRFSNDLGFNIAFANEERGLYSDNRFANSFALLSVISSLLLLLLLLQVLLYFKFKKENSNLIISLITLLFLVAIFSAHILLFFPLSGFWNAIVSNFINSTAFAAGMALIPYSLTLLFRIKMYDWVKHILWLLLIRTLNYYFQVLPIIVFDSLVILCVIFITAFLMIKALKNKTYGVHYVTFGAIGTSVFLLINRLQSAGMINLSTQFNYLDIILLYTCFPLGIYIYNTIQYGRLFNSMEIEVANRTHELNVSIENLKKMQTLLAARNAENELLLKEIHHRVKNNLEVVASLLALQSAKIDDPQIQDAMLASQNRVQSMGILHQKLYQSEHLAFIEMKNYFENLCENILDSYNETDRIKVDVDMKEIDLDIDTAVPLGLIVNELFTNSLKYAFPMGVKGVIKLCLESLADGNLNLKVSDNGIGKKINSLPLGTGFGTQLVDLLTRQIDGKLEQEFNNGTMISIKFKRQFVA